MPPMPDYHQIWGGTDYSGNRLHLAMLHQTCWSTANSTMWLGPRHIMAGSQMDTSPIDRRLSAAPSPILH